MLSFLLSHNCNDLDVPHACSMVYAHSVVAYVCSFMLTLWLHRYVSCVLGCPYQGDIAPSAVVKVHEATFTAIECISRD